MPGSVMINAVGSTMISAPCAPLTSGHPTETLADVCDGITGIDHGVAEIDHECHQLVQRGTVDR